MGGRLQWPCSGVTASPAPERYCRGDSTPRGRYGLNTKGSTGKLVLHIIGAIAEFEWSLTLERTVAGLKSAWAQGAKSGPPAPAAPPPSRG